MRSQLVSLVLAVLVAASAGTARSAALIVEDEWRWVRAGGAPSGVFVESDGSPHFTASIDGSCCSLHAEQDSTLAEDSFFGTGSFSATSEASEAAYSYFGVVFHVSEIATYVLEGSFPSQQGAGQFTSTYQTTFLDPEFSVRLLLVPGETYSFTIQGWNYAYRDSSAGWSFTFTAPEPPVWLLSLAALAAFTLRRAERARSPRP